MCLKLVNAYIRMMMSQYNKNWKKEVFFTLRFAKIFDSVTESQQLSFLKFVYEHRLWQKKLLFLLSEKKNKDKD